MFNPPQLDRQVILFVNFHQVLEKPEEGFSKLAHVNLVQFKKQVKTLMQWFDFPPPEIVRDVILGGLKFKSSVCVLTFDDGLACHAHIVAPALEELGVKAVFSICTAPWVDGVVLPVHMQQLLSAAFSYRELGQEIELGAKALGESKSISDVSLEIAGEYFRHEDLETARVRYYLSFVIPQRLRLEVLKQVYIRRFGSEQSYAKKFYITPQEAHRLWEQGHSIGLHSHRHLNLAAYGRTARLEDLKANIAALQQHVFKDMRLVKWISYPYGGVGTVNAAVLEDVHSLGIELGLSMQRGVNVVGQLDPLLLYRADNKDLPCGEYFKSWDRLLGAQERSA